MRYRKAPGCAMNCEWHGTENNARKLRGKQIMSQVIGERYQIEAEIGAGGMGTVFRGIDQQTHQAVAIKQLKADLNQPEVIERFKREGEALRQLNHPNIVKMLDAVEQDGQQ